MFQPETKNETIEVFSSIIDKALKDKRASEPKRQYLGASLWGDTCARKLAYIYHKTPVDEDRSFPGRILRIFDMGHDGESRMEEYLRLAGFVVHTRRPDGKQYGFEAGEGRLKGHIDGVITAGPAIPGLTYPCLWENKALNNKSWNETVKKGVKTSKPLYYAQSNVYMAYLDLPNTLFTIQNRDTGDVAAEVIPFDAPNAQEASDRAVMVVLSNNPEEMSRCTKDRANVLCSVMCDYRNRCWAVASTPVNQVFKPSFLPPSKSS